MNGHKKNPVFILSIAVTMFSHILLISCDNEEMPDMRQESENICFGVSSDENTLTRGVSGRFVLRSKNSSDTLCVRVIVSDEIRPSDFDNKQLITRGAPITKDNFYDKFHVLAYWKQHNTPVENFFYMDEEVTKKENDLWSGTNTHYWPGAEHSLKFYAWAPADAGFTSTPATPRSTVLEYQVPAYVTDQKDIMVANPEETPGNYYAPQPLTFQHICTAVRFETGSQMQFGRIESVTLKEVYSSGSYDMSTVTWTIDENSQTGDFSQTLNKKTTGAETSGTEITPDSGTFMMLPQILPANATVEIAFHDQVMNHTRILSASIAGTEWKMGTTVTYKLSITPEYDMHIEVPTEMQDAHYISFPITVNVKDYTGNWELTSNMPDDVFFTDKRTDLQKQGYWIEEDKGQSVMTGKGHGSFTYYAYITENVTDTTRNIEFQISPVTDGNIPAPTTAKVQQLCPSWNTQGIGYERIEEHDGGSYPFGFFWNRKVTYSYKGFTALLFKWSVDSYVTEETESYLDISSRLFSITVTIDYAKLNNVLNMKTNTEDGLSNTGNLYAFNDIGIVSNMEASLDNITVGSETWQDKDISGEDYQTVLHFAAKMAVMKNKFGKEVRTETNHGETSSYEVPIIKEEEIKWYLPASNEQRDMTDETYPLSGIYWSSTPVHDNINAYAYSGGVQTPLNRMKNNKIRAARKKSFIQ